MKYQSLFSGKNISLLSAEFAHRGIKVKFHFSAAACSLIMDDCRE